MEVEKDLRKQDYSELLIYANTCNNKTARYFIDNPQYELLTVVNPHIERCREFSFSKKLSPKYCGDPHSRLGLICVYGILNLNISYLLNMGAIANRVVTINAIYCHNARYYDDHQ